MFDEIIVNIKTAEKKKISRKIYNAAQTYDNFILGISIVPDEAVNFLVEIFSSKELFENKGIEHFLLEVNVDLLKYTIPHRLKILEVLSRNADNFAMELSRHSIGDFIARAYSCDVAYKTLLQLSEGRKNEKHVAFVGVDILMRRLNKNSDIYPLVSLLWRKLLNE